MPSIDEMFWFHERFWREVMKQQHKGKTKGKMASPPASVKIRPVRKRAYSIVFLAWAHQSPCITVMADDLEDAIAKARDARNIEPMVKVLRAEEVEVWV